MTHRLAPQALQPTRVGALCFLCDAMRIALP
jgi:hypothetical protein